MSDSPISASAASSAIRRSAPGPDEPANTAEASSGATGSASASPDEAALLAQAKSGSSSAFDQIITIHQENIARLVHRLLGWQSDVDDIVQDVFVDALKNLPRFDGRSSVLTWLTRLAINRTRTHQRKQWLRRYIPLGIRNESFSRDAQAAAAERVSAITDSAEHQITTTETTQQIHTAIRQLNHHDREIIVLHYLQELSITQISQALKLSRGAVDVRLTRARHRLEKILKPILEK